MEINVKFEGISNEKNWKSYGKMEGARREWVEEKGRNEWEVAEVERERNKWVRWVTAHVNQSQKPAGTSEPPHDREI